MAQNDTKSGIRRRTLVAGTAWALPAVTLAAPAMAYTLSGNLVTATGVGGKLPGNSCCSSLSDCPYYKQGYRYYFRADNPPGKDACIEITQVRIGGVVQSTYQVWLSNNTVATGCCGRVAEHSFVVPATQSQEFAIDIDMTNSANTTIDILYDVYDAKTCIRDFANQAAGQSPATPVVPCAPY